MPRIPSTLEFQGPVKERLWNMMRKLWEQLAQVVNGNIEFGRTDGGPANAWFNQTNGTVATGLNIQGVFVSVTVAPTANVATVITHNLGRFPQGVIVIGCNNNGATGGQTVYYSSTDYAAWTKTQMTLRFSASLWTLLYVF
jgi:hypothetical protein